MEHIHKRFTSEQVKVLLKAYCQGTQHRAAIEEILGIGKTRFFALLRRYRHEPHKFSFAYQRKTLARIPDWVEKEIEKELMLEKNLIDDSTLPITNYLPAAGRQLCSYQRPLG